MQMVDGQFFDVNGDPVLSVNHPNDDSIIDYLFSYPLVPGIMVPCDTEKILIHDDGAVWVLQSEHPQLQNIGQIELATFANPDGLHHIGKNLYRETEASGRATENTPGLDGTGVLKTQYLEKAFVPSN
jgi:flagellar basal-body rod protein FlgG